ncbi:MAG: Hpt domain-containing protein [Planctomycetota bacterium]
MDRETAGEPGGGTCGGDAGGPAPGEVGRSQGRPARAAPGGKVIDREAALELMGGDLDLLAATIENFLEMAPEMLRDVREAVAARDPKKVALSAHSVKGIAANLDARRLAAEARRIEVLAREGDLAGVQKSLADFEREFELALEALREEMPA